MDRAPCAYSGFMKVPTLVIVVLAAVAGWFAGRLPAWRHAESGAVPRKIIAYPSPMHPWVKSDHPGRCTVCGMDLVPIYERGKNFDGEAAGLVMLPPGSPQVIGV